MRRMLSGFLAASMVASVCATMSFAAEPAKITFTFPGGDKTQVGGLDAGDAAADAVTVTYDRVQLVANPTDQDPEIILGEVSLPSDLISEDENENGTVDAIDAEKWAKALNKVKFQDVKIDGKFYQVTLGYKTNNSVVATFSPAVAVKGINDNNYILRLKHADKDKFGLTTANGAIVDGKGGETANIEQGGSWIESEQDRQASDVLVCYGDGTPIPLTEDPIGVNNDQNDEGGVQSSKTVYFMLRDDVVPRLSDDSYWKLKITKGDNGKYIKAVSDATKNFSGNLYDVNTGRAVEGTGGSRHRYIKVELNEIFTDDEIKMTLDMRISAKSKAADTLDGVEEDTEIKVKDFSFYMKNLVRDADNEWVVGTSGLMLNPVKNDWNEVTYTNENGDVAFLRFFGDSDTGKFYAKLSTMWEHSDYASYFNDQDAYIFQFTGSPSLSSTSRADLEIYNPFVDHDGNETFDPEQAVIYQVMDGDLFDITSQFEYREGSNGDMAYCTRVRFLGTFIICQKPVDEASTDDVVDLVPDDLVPDTNTGAPVEVNPGNNGGSGSKAPANTGKF